MFQFMREHRYYVYIMASDSGTLYVGMGRSAYDRSTSHKPGTGGWFTAKYGCDRLVYYEVYQYVRIAIARETQLKKWRREKKVALIERVNPKWLDLAKGWGKPLECSEKGFLDSAHKPRLARNDRAASSGSKGIPRLGAQTAPRSE